MNSYSPWETDTEVSRYSPSGYGSWLYYTCRNGLYDYVKGVQAVRKEYEDGPQLVKRISDTFVSSVLCHTSATRLKGIRYRWLKFNPAAPFAHFACATPAAYSKRMSLLLSHDRYKSSGNAYVVDHTSYHESNIIGVESLVFKGGSNGWTTADITALQAAKYQISTPDDLPAAVYDVASSACTSVITQPVKLDIAVDANRDGLITFDGKDETSQEKPYRFWQNYNQDELQTSWAFGDFIPETIPPAKQDYNDLQIQSTRDLQDFARLKLRSTLPPYALASGEIQLGLKWKDVPPPEQTDGFPSIRLFEAVEQDGGLQYLKTPEFARRQVAEKGQALADANGKHILNAISYAQAADFTFSKETLEKSASNLNLLFEGGMEGKARLALVVMDKDGNVLGEGGSTWVDIKNIEHMYMRAHTTPPSKGFHEPYDIFKDESPIPPAPYSYKYVATGAYVKDTSVRSHYGVVIEPSAIGWLPGFDVNESFCQFEPLPDEEKKCVVFVHGINMSVDEVKAYTAAFYKRLWWEGYKGRLAVFRWPTHIQADDGIDIFNASEYRSWTAGSTLKQYVDWLRNGLGCDWIFGLAAHSLGNPCACSALRQGMVVDNYVMLEAALSTSCLHAPLTPGTPDRLAGHFHKSLANADGSDIGNPSPYDFNDLGYRGYLKDIKQGVKGKITNYHNENDFWLATGTARHNFPRLDSLNVDWITNQAKFKPNGGKNYGFYPIHAPGTGGHTYGRPVVTAHESMSFISRSRTLPTGAELPAANGGIPSPPFLGECFSVDLVSTYNFSNDRSNHSGQFLREIYQLYYDQKMRSPFAVSFYRKLMDDLGVLPNP
ncbi:MAG: alpha/beta hydrolase [Verrucomicrobiota bacterium]